jgi:general secretion pathway protein K
LDAVKYMTPRALSAVLPFLSALPSGTPVNVNTAPPEVLAAIANNLAGEALDVFIAERAAKPFISVAEFRARLPDGAALASDIGLTVSSSYFYVTIEARQGTTRARARALVRRKDGAPPAIVWQVVE